MKFIYVPILILKCVVSFSQVIYTEEDKYMPYNKGTKIIPNYLIKRDTIFIFFEANDKLKCKECKVDISRMIRYPKNEIKKYHTTYNIYFRHLESCHLSTFDIPDEKGKYILTTLELKKSFLRKNKDIILTYNEIMEYGPIYILRAFASKKVFVIDKEEIKKGRLIARQIYFGSSMHQE